MQPWSSTCLTLIVLVGTPLLLVQMKVNQISASLGDPAHCLRGDSVKERDWQQLISEWLTCNDCWN